MQSFMFDHSYIIICSIVPWLRIVLPPPVVLLVLRRWYTICEVLPLKIIKSYSQFGGGFSTLGYRSSFHYIKSYVQGVNLHMLACEALHHVFELLLFVVVLLQVNRRARIYFLSRFFGYCCRKK